MARPVSSGLEYFPHDVDASNDEKIEALRSLYGNDGYAFYFILLERIYRTNNAELDVSDAETRQILSRKVGVSLELFDKMLSTAIKHGCFDKEEFGKRGVLTSNGIKKRLNVVTAKREKMRDRYNKYKEVNETKENICSIPSEVSAAETIAESTQSKVKERKEESTNVDSLPANPENDKKSNYSDESLNFVNWFKTLLPDDIAEEKTEVELNNWRDTYDKLIRIDKLTKKQIQIICEYARGDPFWSANFLSPCKLRRKNDDGVKYSKYFLNKIESENKNGGTQTNRTNHGKSDYQKRLELDIGEERRKFFAGNGNDVAETVEFDVVQTK